MYRCGVVKAQGDDDRLCGPRGLGDALVGSGVIQTESPPGCSCRQGAPVQVAGEGLAALPLAAEDAGAGMVVVPANPYRDCRLRAQVGEPVGSAGRSAEEIDHLPRWMRRSRRVGGHVAYGCRVVTAAAASAGSEQEQPARHEPAEAAAVQRDHEAAALPP